MHLHAIKWLCNVLFIMQGVSKRGNRILDCFYVLNTLATQIILSQLERQRLFLFNITVFVKFHEKLSKDEYKMKIASGNHMTNKVLSVPPVGVDAIFRCESIIFRLQIKSGIPSTRM